MTTSIVFVVTIYFGTLIGFFWAECIHCIRKFGGLTRKLVRRVFRRAAEAL